MAQKKKNSTQESLEKVGMDVVRQIKQAKNPSLTIPIRSLSNVQYDEKTRTLALGDKEATRSFFNVAHAKKFLQTVEVASVSYNLLKEGKHASLRDVFYQVKRTLPGTKINIVDDQTETDSCIEDLELMTDLSREQFHVNANKMGSVAGKVIIEDRGDIIDWSKLGSGGWSIPSNVEEIIFKKVDAQFVIYLEKAAEWERLHEDRVWDKLNCIIISSQGQATRGIRRLLQRLSIEEKMPIYILTDFDPWGFYIYSVIKTGSISLAHASERLAVPNSRFLGMTC